MPCLLGEQMRARRALQRAFIHESGLSISLARIVSPLDAAARGWRIPLVYLLYVRLAPRWE